MNIPKFNTMIGLSSRKKIFAEKLLAYKALYRKLENEFIVTRIIWYVPLPSQRMHRKKGQFGEESESEWLWISKLLQRHVQVQWFIKPLHSDKKRALDFARRKRRGAFIIEASSNSSSQIKGSLEPQRCIWFLSCRTIPPSVPWAAIWVLRWLPFIISSSAVQI